MNDIAVDVEIARQSRRQQARHKRADDIGATRRAPVMTAKVSLAPGPWPWVRAPCRWQSRFRQCKRWSGPPPHGS